MTGAVWFEEIPVIGRMEREQAEAKLMEVGESEVVFAMAGPKGQGPLSYGLFDFLQGDRAWRHTAHAFGYIPPMDDDAEVIPVSHIGDVKADEGLKNSKLKITLDALRIADYPGSGNHRILFDFYAQNQVQFGVEHVHFNSTYRVREGERAAILGYPIFLGLNVGSDGIAFRCFTINVQNEQDEEMLSMMESDVFKAGLKLANTLQPAIAPLTGLSVALTKSLAVRHRNVPVQDFYLGLDFSETTVGARLAIGSYIAVQIPQSFTRIWSWNDWMYNRAAGEVVGRTDHDTLIPYNYIIFSVNRYSEQ